MLHTPDRGILTLDKIEPPHKVTALYYVILGTVRVS